jgi:multidrug resistance efflux pump
VKVDPLPPIPSPPAHLWRQFRVKVLPLVTFLGALGATLWLWTVNQANPLVMGTAQGVEADVTSPKPGTLIELHVVRYQEVKQGDVIAVLREASTEVATNTLAVLRAEMEVLRTQGGYDAGDRLRYGQFRLDWMLQRAELVALQQQVTYAEAEYRRNEQLLANKIVDASAYDIAKRDLEQARESVAALSHAIELTEQTLQELDPNDISSESPSLRASLELLDAKLRLLEMKFQPVLLKSPIDGRISKINKLQGTVVAEGEVIISIASPHVDCILGYIAQPVRVEPSQGMDVEVRSRGLHRAVGQAQVTEVGPRIEIFNAPLRIRGMGNAQQRGLPILVSIQPNMPLRPGELVDLRLLPPN